MLLDCGADNIVSDIYSLKIWVCTNVELRSIIGDVWFIYVVCYIKDKCNYSTCMTSMTCDMTDVNKFL